jgi:hypothetical protein
MAKVVVGDMYGGGDSFLDGDASVTELSIAENEDGWTMSKVVVKDMYGGGNSFLDGGAVTELSIVVAELNEVDTHLFMIWCLDTAKYNQPQWRWGTVPSPSSLNWTLAECSLVDTTKRLWTPEKMFSV